MTNPSLPDEGRDALIAGYIDRLNAGEPLDPEDIRAAHPALADELIEFLRDFESAGAGELDASRPGSAGQGFPRDFGGYRLLRELGRGGMGVVYEAVETALDRKVALKVLPGGLLVNQKAVARFRREARIVGRLDHPAIVAVHGTGVEGDTPFISMELVPGETLEKVLERERPPVEEDSRNWASRVLTRISRAFAAKDTTRVVGSEPSPRDEAGGADAPFEPVEASPERLDLAYMIRAAGMFAGVAEGLAHAHAKGIVHRDLKPSNLILDPDGSLRILDFGIARLEGQEGLTLSGEVMGTPRYMSPEQASARQVEVDHRTDIYSLGATLYEVITLAPPIGGKSVQETIQRILHVDPRPPRTLNPRIPRDLETIVLKCLAKSPENRYGTAEALAQDLRRSARGDPVEARPESFGEKAWRRARRNRGKIGLAALLALLALLASLAAIGIRKEHRAMLARKEAEYPAQVIDGVVKLQMSGILFWKAGLFAWSSEGYDASRLTDSSGKSENELARSAVQIFEAARDAVPDRADAYYHLARGLTLLGEAGRARTELDRAVELEFAPAMLLEADQLEEKGDAAGAAALRSRASREEVKMWVAASTEAQRADRERRWQDSAREYDKLIDLERARSGGYLGSSVDVYVGSGLARLHLEDFSGARERFAAASALSPQAKELELFVGVTYLAEGSDRRAEEIFERVHRQDSSGKVPVLVALLYTIQFARYEKGLVWADRVRPGYNREVWRAMCLNGLERFPEAVEAARGLPGVQPGYALSYIVPAVALIGVKDFAGAGEMASKAISLAPKSSVPYMILANVRRLEGRVADCASLLEKAIEVEPTATRAHYYLSYSYLDANRLDEAARSLRRAIELADRAKVGTFASGEPQLVLSHVLDLLGDKEGSLAEIRKALDLAKDPGLIDARWLPRLARAQTAAGRRGDAVRALENCLERADDFGMNLAPIREQLEESSIAALPDLPTMGAVDRALARSRRVALVEPPGPWRYFRGRSDPSAGAEWAALDFDDASWEQGPAGFGYGDDDDATVLDDMKGAYTSVYVRRSFTVDDPTALERVTLSVKCDDGFVAYLNGTEIARWRAPLDAVLAHDARASEAATEPLAAVETSLAGVELPRRGRNVLAIQGLNTDLDSGDQSLIPSLRGESRDSSRTDGELLSGFRGAASGPGSGARLAYLEGRILLRQKKPGEAVEKLEAAWAAESSSAQPAIALAESLAAVGEPARAAETLRLAIEASTSRETDLWTPWASIVLGRLGRNARDALNEMPCAKQGAVDEGKRSRACEGRAAEDVRWILATLAAGKPVRIHCGGGEYTATDGKPWSRDRFYAGGKTYMAGRRVYRGEIAGTDDDPLYETERYFPTEDRISGDAYLIPLPRGRYRVTLHFAEIAQTAGGRRVFDVLLEGKPCLAAFDPSVPGLATAGSRSFDVEVADGVLEIGFRARLDRPKFSAIEIEAE